MEILDISWPISEEITAYKNRKTVCFTHTKNFEADGVRESTIQLGSHTGTHVDAPSHFLENGGSINKYSLATLCGLCVVFDLMDVEEKITKEDLQDLEIKNNKIVIFKTKNSMLGSNAAFNPGFVYLDPSAAQYLAQHHVKAVGIDYLGIERNSPKHETHTALLEKNIPIIEGLRLKNIIPGEYTLICLPLNIIGLEAAPARAILLKS